MKGPIALAALLFCAATIIATAQEPPPTPLRTRHRRPPRPRRPGTARRTQCCLRRIRSPTKRSSPKKPNRRQGIFTVHQVKDKYYYEIPEGGARTRSSCG